MYTARLYARRGLCLLCPPVIAHTMGSSSLKRSRATLEEDDELPARSACCGGDKACDTPPHGPDHRIVYQGALDLALPVPPANKKYRPAATRPLDELSLYSPTPTLSPSLVDMDRFSFPPSPRPILTTALFDLSDWQSLKALHASAMQLFDGEFPSHAAPVLRRVLAECDRFLIVHRDPSIVYAPSIFTPPHTPPQAATSVDHLEHQTSPSALQLDITSTTSLPLPREPVAAFYALYGAALFAFGSLVAREPSIATPQDFPNSGFYFGRALDVLDYGENHPRRSMTAQSDRDSRVESFDLAITYGRTLLYLAAEHVRADIDRTVNAAPLWPADSPFALRQLPIPPRRLSLASLGAPGIFALAADQLLRAFLHMPHAGYTSSTSSARRCHPLFKTCKCPVNLLEHERPFPRCRLFNSVGNDVLRIAASLPRAQDRKKWALWAEVNAFKQMLWESEADGWQTVREISRGKCRLLAARACLGKSRSRRVCASPPTQPPKQPKGWTIDPHVPNQLSSSHTAVEHLSKAVSPQRPDPAAQQEARALLAEAHSLLCVKTRGDVDLDVSALPCAIVSGPLLSPRWSCVKLAQAHVRTRRYPSTRSTPPVDPCPGSSPCLHVMSCSRPLASP
ncbi:hypothetical protein BKA62DRAFT_689056 [Auriculariales sp. MPI-PUGE-AT-0066]|nr:hypothetical protein BKA62DRAFT_689056 [Auriculariales sp. MPI-PUGE-AT-0066]